MAQHEEAVEYESKQRKSRRSDFAAREHAEPALAGWRGEAIRGVATPDTVLSIQRLAGNAATVQLLSQSDEEVDTDEAGSDRSPVLDVVGRGGGQPLDERTRLSMERGLGADLSDVRVHHDAAASASAQAVNAHAYTVGNEVVFQSGLYKPDSAEGRRMLAHELTHVVQQRSGPVEGTDTGEGIAVSHPEDRFERAAETNADRVMAAGDSTLKTDLRVPGAERRSGLAEAGVAQRDAEIDELEGEENQAEEAVAQAQTEIAEVEEAEEEGTE